MSQSQSKWILAQLKRGFRLTPLDALHGCGCMRLGARIYDLRQAGHKIISAAHVGATGKRYAEYRLARTPRRKP